MFHQLEYLCPIEMAFRTAINMELIQNVKWLYFALVQLMSLIWFHTRHLGQFVHRNLMIFGDYYKQPRALLSQQQRLLFFTIIIIIIVAH